MGGNDGYEVVSIYYCVDFGSCPLLTLLLNIRLAGWQSIGTVSVALAKVGEGRKVQRKLVRLVMDTVSKFSTSR